MSQQRPQRLLAEERRRGILQLVDQHGRVTIEEVIERFSVSAVTARSDLDALSAAGSLVRSHGGGIRPLAMAPDISLKMRESLRRNEKEHIADAAIQLIGPQQTVILCSGTTSACIASRLRHSRLAHLTVITYSLNVASCLAEANGIALVMIGGMLRQVSKAFVGPHAEQMMASLHADHCFLSTVGLDAEVGLTTLDIMEAQLNQQVIRASKEVTVIADSSKFGHRSLSLICDFTKINRLITDRQAPVRDLDLLRKKGVEVILAD